MEPIRISPSNLATMSSPHFCPRCFRRLLKNRFKVPFRKPMPAIMHSMDAFEKQIARVWFDKYGQLPKFFGPFRYPKSLLDVEWVSFTDADTGVTVRGKIDIGLQMKKGVVVLDDKTSRHRGDDDIMFPIYRTQTNCYGRAFEDDDPENPVVGLGLLHYEHAPLSDDEIPDYVNDDSVRAKFTPKLVEVEFAPIKWVQPLLEALRGYWEMSEDPDPREGCPDCELLDTFLAPMTDFAGVVEYRLMDRREAQQAQARKRYLDFVRQNRRVQADGVAAMIQAAAIPYGVLANWDSLQ